MKYRIIRKSMLDYCGMVQWKGYTSVFLVQYKSWAGFWRDMPSTMTVTEKDAFTYLEMAKKGRLTKKGDQIYEDN